MRIASLLCLVALATCGADPGPGESMGGPAAASGSRLKLQFLEGADGSRLPQGLWDSERNESCEPMSDEVGVTRCLPKSSAVSVDGTGAEPPAFADPACTQPAVAAGGGCIANPRYLLQPTNAGGVTCGGPTPTWRVNLIKSRISQPYRRDGEGKCAAVFGLAYVVEPIPASAFVALTRKAL